MAEKSQKPLSYFFKRRKHCEDESDKESTTMQVAHEELNDVDDPTEEILVIPVMLFITVIPVIPVTVVMLVILAVTVIPFN